MGALYTELLSGMRGLELPVPKIPAAENIYWVYGIVLSDSVPFDAAQMMERLKELGIGTRPFFWGMHEQPVLQKQGLFKNERYPTERISRRGFYLPSGLALTEEKQRRAVNAMIKALAA